MTAWNTHRIKIYFTWNSTFYTKYILHEVVHYVFFKILFILREKRREGEREGEKHQCEREVALGCLLHTTPTRDWTNPDIYLVDRQFGDPPWGSFLYRIPPYTSVLLVSPLPFTLPQIRKIVAMSFCNLLLCPPFGLHFFLGKKPQGPEVTSSSLYYPSEHVFPTSVFCSFSSSFSGFLYFALMFSYFLKGGWDGQFKGIVMYPLGS